MLNKNVCNFLSPYSFHELVEEISELTGLNREIVERKVWLEVLYPGCNVMEDAINFGIDFHIYNQKMESFYKETFGFIFESMVEFCRPGKQKVLNEIRQRVDRYLETNSSKKINVLMFGDGVGSDTIYLYGFYKNYANFFYFDIPGSKTFDFAVKRFRKHSISVELITDYRNIPKNFFDVVISLEVLEHLPNPEEAIRDISKFLKNNGIVLVTESFGAVSPNFPTHLSSNLKYEGRTPFLFLKHNLLLTYYSRSLLFRPIEFTKKDNIDLVEKYKIYFSSDILKTFLKSKVKQWLRRVK